MALTLKRGCIIIINYKSMGNCAACADQAGGTDSKLTELPDSLAFTELTQMHYIEQATEAGGPAKV